MSDVIALGSRRELMVDDFLTDSVGGGLQLRLGQPQAREVVLTTDQPWEGNMCNMVTILQDPSTRIYRMYYREGSYTQLANNSVRRLTNICVAESVDGITWKRRLSTAYPGPDGQPTNMILKGELPHSAGTVGFAPFFDTNPKGNRSVAYKAIGSDDARPPTGLFLSTSYDGIHWERQGDKPMFDIARSQRMRFDSLNTMFWDPNINKYRLYYRDYDENENRCIRMSTSDDLKHWSEPIWIAYGDSPLAQMYTNNIQPYARAPHMLLGFPLRYTQRTWSPTMDQLPELEHRAFRRHHAVGERSATALTDGLFMSSRDGENFHRWDEAFFRPGMHEKGNWAYGDNTPINGMIVTPAAEAGDGQELSMYTVENYWRGSRFRRHTLRIDGFASRWAPFKGGTWTTKPITFTGSRLSLNMATSAAGNIRVEIQDKSGKPIEGYTLADCHEIVGDTLDYVVTWKATRSVEKLIGRVVKLKFELHDANLYSMQFRD